MFSNSYKNLQLKMSLNRNICVNWAIFVIFIALSKGDQGEVTTYSEDAKEILPGRTYYWKDWCFCQEEDYLYIWSESAVLEFWIKATEGWFYIVTDGKLFLQDDNGELINKLYPENLLKLVRSMINSTTHTQPILSHAGSNKIIVGNWFLISPKGGEMIIQHSTDKLPIITLREDFPGFTYDFGDKKNQTFLPKTSLGAEFSTSRILGRTTNRLRSKAETLKPKIENQINENNPDNALTEIQCNTHSRLLHISYTWNIENIDFHRPAERNNHTIFSPIFSSAKSDKIKWGLEIVPGNRSSAGMALYLCLSDKSKTQNALAKYVIYFYDNQRHLVQTYNQHLHIYYKGKGGWGWGNIPFNEVVSSDGKLHMVCNITFCESTNSTVSCGSRTDTNSNHKCELISESVPTTKNNEFPDIVLVLTKTGKEYPANKTILAARSPVFAAMFNASHTEKNKKIDRVNITDLHSEQVFDELLKYIYTSKCENIENLAHDLLIAAHKYELNDLKGLCVEKISNNLTVGNAVDTLNLAHKHGFDELKSKAIRYIASNYAAISNTTDWKRIVETNSKFLHKVCQVLSYSNITDKELAEE